MAHGWRSGETVGALHSSLRRRPVLALPAHDSVLPRRQRADKTNAPRPLYVVIRASAFVGLRETHQKADSGQYIPRPYMDAASYIFQKVLRRRTLSFIGGVFHVFSQRRYSGI